MYIYTHVWASLVAQTVKNPPGFNPWVRKMPWRRAWQPTPGFFPGKPHGQRTLGGVLEDPTVHGVAKSQTRLSD